MVGEGEEAWLVQQRGEGEGEGQTAENLPRSLLVLEVGLHHLPRAESP